MQKAVPENDKAGQSVSDTSRTQFQRPPSSGEPTGHLAQLAALANHSPRVEAQRKLAEDLHRSSRTEKQRSLAAEMNAHAPLAQLMHSPIVQFGGSKWTPHDERSLIKKIGESEGIALFYTRDSSSYYVEGFKNGKYGGAVQLEPKGKFLAMHTRSEEGMEGGLGVVMMNSAIKIAAEHHTGFDFVQLTPAPGAASKKVIELLSQKVGDPKLHAEAGALRDLRIKGQKGLDLSDEKDRDKRLQTWSPSVLPEHHKHLEALVASDKTEGIKITGPGGALIGYPEEALAEPSAHIEAISQQEHPSGYGIEILMKTFLKIAL